MEKNRMRSKKISWDIGTIKDFGGREYNCRLF